MITKQITAWVSELLKGPDFEDCMLIDIVYNPGNQKVEVFIDSDGGISFEKCRIISRHIEEKLDEGQYLGEKYTLEVSSPGGKRPLKYFRQYAKHTDRNLKVVLKNGVEEEGILKSVVDQEISLEVLRKVEKKKVKETIQIPFEDIKHSFVLFKF